MEVQLISQEYIIKYEDLIYFNEYIEKGILSYNTRHIELVKKRIKEGTAGNLNIGEAAVTLFLLQPQHIAFHYDNSYEHITALLEDMILENEMEVISTTTSVYKSPTKNVIVITQFAFKDGEVETSETYKCDLHNSTEKDDKEEYVEAVESNF